jgi:hypothetical protein
MNRLSFVVVLAAGFVSVAVPAVAKPKAPPALDAAMNVLMEELDSVNAVNAAHTKEISDLKQHIADMDALLKKATEETRTLVAVEVEASRKALAAAESRLTTLESRQVYNGRKLPWLVPMLEVRLRPMYDKNRTDTDTGRGDSDLYYLQRIRLGLTVTPWKGVQGVLVLQDSREWGEEKSTTSNQHSLDLYQGYLLFDDIAGSGAWIQAGRFAMKYGANRQVSVKDFNNVGQAFDGVRIGWRRARVMAADAFVTFYRNGFAPVFQPQGQDRYSVFAGMYLSTDAVSWLDAELYGFYQDNGFVTQRESIGTIGARLVARPVKGLTLEGEAAVQVGRVTVRDESAVLRDASHLATAYFLQAKYTAPIKTDPWIGLFFYSASGDANPWDGSSVAYRPLFPSGKGNMGNMELFRWQGVWDIGPTVGLYPAANVRLSFDYHVYSMTTDGGNLQGFDAQMARASDPYPSALVNRTFNVPAGGSRFLGQEMDVELTWKPVDVLALGLGYSFFKAGAAALRGQVLSVGERTATVDGSEVTTPYWKRDYRMGNDMAHRVWIEATLSL